MYLKQYLCHFIGIVQALGGWCVKKSLSWLIGVYPILKYLRRFLSLPFSGPFLQAILCNGWSSAISFSSGRGRALCGEKPMLMIIIIYIMERIL